MVAGRRISGQAWWSLGLVCLVLLLVMGSASLAAGAKKSESDRGPPMRFVVVRSNAVGCEPNCPEWISAEGTIEAGTPALLKRMLKRLGGRKLPIVVDSPGGNVDAALTLGRLIRKSGLDIAVGKTWFDGCMPDDRDCAGNKGGDAIYFGEPYASGAICNSACPLMFAGGVRRVVGEWAYLGVHQITTTYTKTKMLYRTTYKVVNGKKKVISTKVVSRKNAGSYKTYEMSKAVEKRLAAYFREMGVGEGVLTTMKNTPASDIHQLVLENMLRMNLVTSMDSVDLLTAAAICKARPTPANCREIPGNKDAAPAAAVAAEAEPAPATTVRPEIVKRDEDMRFVVVRGSNPLCNPDCPEWISAEGTITAYTPERLRDMLDGIDGRRLPLVISSPGGDVQGALATGRLIREHKLDVAIARTDFVGCDLTALDCAADSEARAGLTVDAEGVCDSACAILLAGGVRRLVGPRARLSVHSLGMERQVKTYLQDMAIGPGLFPAMQSVPYSSHRQLEPDMMLKVGLTTGPQSVDALTGATICAATPKPENCRVAPSPNAQADAPAKL